MPEKNANGNASAPEAPDIEPVDLAIVQLETFIRGIEAERTKAEELAKVPEDIPRFVTRIVS